MSSKALAESFTDNLSFLGDASFGGNVEGGDFLLGDESACQKQEVVGKPFTSEGCTQLPLHGPRVHVELSGSSVQIIQHFIDISGLKHEAQIKLLERKRSLDNAVILLKVIFRFS